METNIKAKKVFALLFALLMAFSCVLAACTNNSTTIFIQMSATTIAKGETVSILALASNGEDCKFAVSDPSLVVINNNNLTVVNEPDVDTDVTITATLTSNASVFASKTLTVKAAIPVAPEVEVIASTYELTKSNFAKLTVSVSDGADYEVTVSDANLVHYYNGNLTVTEEPAVDTPVTVTIRTLGAVPTVKEVDFTVKAKAVKQNIVITTTASELNEEDKVAVMKVASPNNAEYTLKVTKGAEYVTLNQQDGTVTWKADNLAIDTYITVTATLDSDATVYDSYNLVIRAKRSEGKVMGVNGIELTAAKIEAIGNASITATGTLTDYYNNLVTGSSTTNVYDMKVMMSEGAWYGTWNIAGDTKNNVVTDNYRMGKELASTDELGNHYHGLNRVFIDKDNKVAQKPITDYLSIPTTWESQHLWNHLAQLPIGKIVNAEAKSAFDLTPYGYESNDGYAVFRYATDNATTTMEEWYLLTYLSYCLTPMLSDTLVDVYLVVDKDGVVGFIAQTETMLSYGSSEIDDEGYEAGDDADPVASYYTIMNIRFSDVGTTVVPNPEVYTTGSAGMLGTTPYDALKLAVKAMGGSTNYTFLAEEITTYAPSYDEGDYQVDSSVAYSTSSTSSSTPTKAAGHPAANQLSSTGKVGVVGYVTKDAILLAETGKYSYSMDDKLYHTEFTGYKQFDGYYEEFAYDYKVTALHGTKRISGSILDLIPQFNFAAEIFKYTMYKEVENIGSVFTFVLRDDAIARSVAEELSMDSNARYATSSIQYNFTLEVACDVDEDGNITNARIIKAVYPYNISGIYSGYIEVTYDNFGTTVLDEEGSKFEGLFENYVHREIKSDWSMYVVEDYYWKHTLDHTKNYGCYDEDSKTWTCIPSDGYRDGGHVQTAEYVFKAIFGEDNYKLIPQASVFMEVFGDNIYGPWFDYNESDKYESGYRDSIGFTTNSEAVDENSQLANFDEIYELLVAKLTALGYAVSESNTDISGGASGRSNRYITFISENGQGDIEIVVENNYSRYFWIDFYVTGDWSLNR